MSSFAKLLFSESVDGEGVLISTSGSPGTLIHTADATALDEIWLYAINNGTVLNDLTIEWGESAAKGHIIQTIPIKSGLVLIVPGLILTNSLSLRAFSETANFISVHGFVNRITQ